MEKLTVSSPMTQVTIIIYMLYIMHTCIFFSYNSAEIIASNDYGRIYSQKIIHR